MLANRKNALLAQITRLTQKHTPTLVIALLLVSFTALYLSPLTQPETLVGQGDDVYSHTWVINWFCNNFFSYNFHTPTIHAPFGVNLSRAYDAPLIMTLACPLSPQGPLIMMNFFGALQVLIIIGVSFIVSQRYFHSSWMRLAFIFLYSFSAFTLTKMTHHLTLLSTVWGAALVFYAFDRVDLTKLRSVVLAFIALGVVILSAWQNITNVVLLVAVLLSYQLWQKRVDLLQSFVHIFISTGLMSLGLAIFMLPILVANTSELASSGRGMLHFTNLASYLYPSHKHLLFTQLSLPWSSNDISEKQYGLDPLILIAIACMLVWSFRQKHLPSEKRYLLLIALYAIIPFEQHVNVGHLNFTLGRIEFIHQVIPFSLSRVPARMAIVLVFLLTLISLRFIEQYIIHQRKMKLFLPIVCLYSLLASTILVKNTQVSTTNIREAFPLKALTNISHDPRPGFVLNIPLAVMTDQTQMLEQLYHQKPMIAGYTSYAAYEPDTLHYIQTSPGLEWLDCSFMSRYLVDADVKKIFPQNSYSQLLSAYLHNQKIFWVIINKNLLQPECHNLDDFYQTNLSSSPYFNLMEENENIAVYSVAKQDSNTSKPYPYLYLDPAGYRIDEDKVVISSKDLGIQITTLYPEPVHLTFNLTSFSGPTQLRIFINNFDQEFSINREQEITIVIPLNYGNNWLYLQNLSCQPDFKSASCEDIIIENIELRSSSSSSSD